MGGMPTPPKYRAPTVPGKRFEVLPSCRHWRRRRPSAPDVYLICQTQAGLPIVRPIACSRSPNELQP